MRDKQDQARRSDANASQYSARYSDADATAERQVALTGRWGTPLGSGSSVLEIGCADGFVTERLTRAGFQVTAVDISPKMIEVAACRLKQAGLQAEFVCADAETFEPDRCYDATIAFRSFEYFDDPKAVLRRWAEHTTIKLLVDVNPRKVKLDEHLSLVREAGFLSVSWRAFFVPQRFRVGRFGRLALRAAEEVPPVRDYVLRHKFVAVVKGEFS